MDICQTCKYLSKHYCKYFKTKNIDMFFNTHCVAYKKKIEKPIRNQIKKNSIKQEKRLAKDLGAKRTPMSGAKDTSPADMLLGNYVIESKATNKDSIVLHKEWLDQLKQSPINFGKIPTLVLDFTNTSDRYIVLDEADFKKIIKEDNNE
jgi:hypothetical protein